VTVGLLLVQLLTGIATGMLYALLAFGLSIIKGLLNIPNFAHGALYLVGAYVAFTIAQATGSFWLGIPVAGIAVAVLGIVIEWVGVRRLYGSAYLFQLLLLFGVALVLEQLVIIIWGPQGNSMPPPPLLMGAVDLGVTLFPKYLIFITLVSALLISLCWLLIERTRYGAMIRAGIERKEMVSALGINIDLLFTSAFALGAGLAALAGALAVPLVGISTGMGYDMLAIAFVVVVLGGLGSLYGAVLAGLLVGIVQSLAALWVPSASTVIIYVAMILVLAIRPQGLLGER
jgi:branched-chain amino acid transport system permease protein